MLLESKITANLPKLDIKGPNLEISLNSSQLSWLPSRPDTSSSISAIKFNMESNLCKKCFIFALKYEPMIVIVFLTHSSPPAQFLCCLNSCLIHHKMEVPVTTCRLSAVLFVDHT